MPRALLLALLSSACGPVAGVDSATDTDYTPALCLMSPCIDESDCSAQVVCKAVLFEDAPNLCTLACLSDEDCEPACGAPLSVCQAGWCAPVMCWAGKPCVTGECREFVDGTAACFPEEGLQ